MRVDVDTPLGEADGQVLDELLAAVFSVVVADSGLPLTASELAPEGSQPSLTPLHAVLRFGPDAHLTGQVSFWAQRVFHPLGDRRLERSVDLDADDLLRSDAILHPKLLTAIEAKHCVLAPPPAVEAVPAGG